MDYYRGDHTIDDTVFQISVWELEKRKNDIILIEKLRHSKEKHEKIESRFGYSHPPPVRSSRFPSYYVARTLPYSYQTSYWKDQLRSKKREKRKDEYLRLWNAVGGVLTWVKP